MALRFIDGCSHYTIPDQILLKYTSYYDVQIASGTGRREGSKAIQLYNSSDYVSLTLDDQNTWIVGFAFKMDKLSSSGSKTLQFFDANSAVQLTLNIVSSVIKLYRGDSSVLLATSENTLGSDVWYYMEVKAVIDNTNGLFEVRINENVWVTYSGDTQYSSTLSTARRMSFHTASFVAALFHDIYVCDGTGTTNNNYLGDVRVDTLAPSGAGATTDFTPTGSAINYENVDETSAVSTTNYNSSDMVGAIDSFVFGDLAAMGSDIKGMQINLAAKKDDSGTRTMKAIARLSNTNYEGDEITMTDSYFIHRQIWEQNPATSEDWDEAAINGAEFGYKVAS